MLVGLAGFSLVAGMVATAAGWILGASWPWIALLYVIGSHLGLLLGLALVHLSRQSRPAYPRLRKRFADRGLDG